MKLLFYSLINDFAFKFVFGNQKNIRLLKMLLKALLNLPAYEFEKITIVDPFLKRLFKLDKQGILDLRAETLNGVQINIEVQMIKLAAFKNRILYYNAKLYAEQMTIGKSFSELKPSICIVILDHVLDPNTYNYINSYVLKNEKTNEVWTDLQKIITIELPKLPKDDDGTAAWELLKCFTFKSKEDFKMFAKAHPNVAPIYEAVKQLSFSKRMRMIHTMREIHRHDIITCVEEAKKEGREEGLEKGITIGEAKSTEIIKAKDVELSEKDAELSEKNIELSEKDAKLSEKDAEIERLKAVLHIKN
jgi:predicted transposase/invertase (TIGR01784 family)